MSDPPKTLSRSAAVYAELESTARRRAEKSAAVAKKNSRSAVVFSRAASEYIRLARLTGSYDDYLVAQELLDSAFEMKLAIPPYMMRAQLHYTLHRLDQAEADFAKHNTLPNKTDEQKASAQLFAANLSYQRGQYVDAKARYDAAVEAGRSPQALASLAYYNWRVTKFDKAEELYRESIPLLGRDAAEPVAWTHLQLGLMDLERGRYADALVHYDEAASFISGYWLIEEHIAEILALQGKIDEAKAAYVRIIERTGNPEFMDAMAGILKGEGDERGAATYVERAGKAYQARLERFPEATYGHALEHYLEFGEPAVALDIAEKNHVLRPNAESKILLAQAQLKANQPKQAVATIEAALATPIRTADMHQTAAEAYKATGAADKAAAQTEAAKAINAALE